MIKSKITLGTVQFGLDYGISNTTGQVDQKAVTAILTTALKNGIEKLDTAYAYGSSEEFLGSSELSQQFKIISKVPANVSSDLEFIKYFKESLNRLKKESLYAYMFHDFNTFLSHKNLLKSINNLKTNKQVEKIGFSLYYPNQLEYLFEHNISFDIVQIPFNILDQRFLPYFKKLKEKGIEIHVRSIFLQGIFFMDHESMIKKFGKVITEITSIQNFAKETNLKLHELLLQVALTNNEIDQVVIGVATEKNLLDNLNLKELSLIEKEYLVNTYQQFASTNEELILPFNWKTI